jgi:poly(3-hydroxybutyrate) depolymerase
MIRKLLLSVLLSTAGLAHGIERLPALGADLPQTTVSGLSSGAYMAVQFHLAHSKVVRGVGVVAGGPWYCAEGNATRAVGECMKGAPDVAPLVEAARRAADHGDIDPIAGLGASRVWMFSGYNDGVVKRSAAERLRDFYQLLAPESERFLRYDLPAGHAMITETAGAACAVTGGQFITDCDYDAAGRLLQFLLGRLRAPAAAPSGRLFAFDQGEFVPASLRSLALSDAGYVYVPADCARSARCRVHVALHGCNQSVEAVGEAFVRQAGYNRWADTNRVIVLYPQARATWGMPWNPYGCWDWWGYTSELYATKRAPQIAVIRAMVDRLASGAAPVSTPSPSTVAPAVIDTTSDAVAIAWPVVGGSIDVAVTGDAGPVAEKRVGGNARSVAFEGLAAGRSYRAVLRHRDAAGNETQVDLPFRTPPEPRPCDPWFGTNVDHVSGGRAYVMWGRAYAVGTNQDLGWWNIFTTHTLHRVSGGFAKGSCG